MLTSIEHTDKNINEKSIVNHNSETVLNSGMNQMNLNSINQQQVNTPIDGLSIPGGSMYLKAANDQPKIKNGPVPMSYFGGNAIPDSSFDSKLNSFLNANNK